jgi:t-SNARE complex subunit (syntaxin)
MEFREEFRIDRDSAQMIAIHDAVEVWRMNAVSLIILMAIRHYRQSRGSYKKFAGRGMRQYGVA